MESIKNALNYGKWKTKNVINENNARLLTIPAETLLSANRFDIALKVHYGRLRSLGMGKAWREKVYEEQALRITGPSNKIKEYDGSGKENLKDFLYAYHSLLDATDTNTLPAIPISSNWIPLDGAHRIATSILKEAPVKTVQFDNEFNIISNFAFYSTHKNGHGPCSSDVLDEGLIEYCRVKRTAAIALIFPCVGNAQQAIKKLEQIADIVHLRKVFMSLEAGSVLLRQVYMGHEWTKWSTQQSGFNHKVKSCFPFSGKVRVVLLDNFAPEQLRDTKEKIRQLYDLGKHSIHITDSTQETLITAKALFNKNSVNLLENSKSKYIESFHDQLSAFREWLTDAGLDSELVCIDSGSVLASFGLREIRDIDFLYHGDESTLPPCPTGIACHNETETLYGKKVNEIVADPNNHYWYMGLKFCTPELVKSMKMSRGETKDKIDINLLNQVIADQHFNKFQLIVSFASNACWQIKLLLKRDIQIAKRRLYPFLVKLGILKRN